MSYSFLNIDFNLVDTRFFKERRREYYPAMLTADGNRI